MNRRRLWLALLPLLCGCLETGMVQLGNLTTELPAPMSAAQWKQEVDGILARYDAAPVLSYADERLRPIFGGITTLTYYGGDLGQKLLDQQIPPGYRAPGASIESVCGETVDAELLQEGDELTRSLHSPVRPQFSPVWLPVSLAGRPLAADATCDLYGAPRGSQPQEHFCMFARMALQSGEGHPLIFVVHGMFDSSAQDYVQRMGAILFSQGHSVLLPDMRDHGDTFRANPQVPTSLGNLEGGDLLHLARAIRAACGPRLSTIGAVGVSGGGLAVIRAQSMDVDGQLDAGAIAMSPLIDLDATIRDLKIESSCSVAEAIELTWKEHALVAAAMALGSGGGAAVAQGLAGDRIDEKTAIAAGIGALAGLSISVLVDALFDGDAALTNDCVARSSVAGLFAEMLHERWRTLQALPHMQSQAAPVRPIAAQEITLEDYLALRSEPFYARLGKPMRHYEASSLAHELRAQPRGPGRLLVLGSADDPVTREPAFLELRRLAGDLNQTHVRAVQQGGHGAMWVVHQSMMARLFGRFFQTKAPRATPRDVPPSAPAGSASPPQAVEPGAGDAKGSTEPHDVVNDN